MSRQVGKKSGQPAVTKCSFQGGITLEFYLYHFHMYTLDRFIELQNYTAHGKWRIINYSIKTSKSAFKFGFQEPIIPCVAAKQEM